VYGGAVRLGLGELIVIGVVLVVVFSASRMGALGNAIGRFVYSFRKASQGEGFIDVTPTAKRTLDKGQAPEDAQVVSPEKPRKP
jgi:sec-independent protein translocase protein TatA